MTDETRPPTAEAVGPTDYLESLWPTRKERLLLAEMAMSDGEIPPPIPDVDYTQDRMLDITFEGTCEASIWESEWDGTHGRKRYELIESARHDASWDVVMVDKTSRVRYVDNKGHEFKTEREFLDFWKISHLPPPEAKPWERIDPRQWRLDEFVAPSSDGQSAKRGASP